MVAERGDAVPGQPRVSVPTEGWMEGRMERSPAHPVFCLGLCPPSLLRPPPPPLSHSRCDIHTARILAVVKYLGGSEEVVLRTVMMVVCVCPWVVYACKCMSDAALDVAVEGAGLELRFASRVVHMLGLLPPHGLFRDEGGPSAVVCVCVGVCPPAGSTNLVGYPWPLCSWYSPSRFDFPAVWVTPWLEV